MKTQLEHTVANMAKPPLLTLKAIVKATQNLSLAHIYVSDWHFKQVTWDLVLVRNKKASGSLFFFKPTWTSGSLF